MSIFTLYTNGLWASLGTPLGTLTFVLAALAVLFRLLPRTVSMPLPVLVGFTVGSVVAVFTHRWIPSLPIIVLGLLGIASQTVVLMVAATDSFEQSKRSLAKRFIGVFWYSALSATTGACAALLVEAIR